MFSYTLSYKLETTTQKRAPVASVGVAKDLKGVSFII